MNIQFIWVLLFAFSCDDNSTNVSKRTPHPNSNDNKNNGIDSQNQDSREAENTSDANVEKRKNSKNNGIVEEKQDDSIQGSSGSDIEENPLTVYDSSEIQRLVDNFKKVKVQSHPWNGPQHTETYTDILVHTKPDGRYEASDNIPTNAHETLHGLTTEMKFFQSHNLEYFFYIGNGEGVFIEEPSMHFRNVAQFVPKSAVDINPSRYDLYMIEQGQYEYTLHMTFDEWAAYVLGTTVAMEMARKGTWPENQLEDKLDGMLEFLVFGSAAIMAIENYEPEYFDKNPEIISLYVVLAYQTIQLLEEGLTYDFFTHFNDELILQNFLDNPDAASLRDSVKRVIGPSWTQFLFEY